MLSVAQIQELLCEEGVEFSVHYDNVCRKDFAAPRPTLIVVSLLETNPVLWFKLLSEPTEVEVQVHGVRHTSGEELGQLKPQYAEHLLVLNHSRAKKGLRLVPA